MGYAIATAPKRDSYHWTAGEVTWDEVLDWVNRPARKKEAGNYLFGVLRPGTTVKHKDQDEPCTNLHRRKDFVVSRSVITLDVDKPERGFAEKVELTFPYRALLHTTYSSTPEDPRYRLLIPTDRTLAPDEYVHACKAVMQLLGADQFDPGTSQPERYMFKPAAQQRGWFESWALEGDVLVVDTLLDGFEEDLSSKAAPKPSRNKRDPFEIEGVIGAFNKAYRDWDLLIETYELPYTKVDEERYQLVGARSVAGMGPVRETDGFVYSHHANDPAYGRICSAFDLVRLHRFGELDEGQPEQTPINRLPSHGAMLELATVDPRIVVQMVGQDFDAQMDEVAVEEDWRSQLRLTPRSGQFMDVIHNWDLVVKHDPLFGLLCFNELSLSVEATTDLPWRPVTETTRTVGNVDRWEFCFYIERRYGFRPTRQFMDSLIDTRAGQTVVNPVRDYLKELVWDGTPRLEECLPGVKSTPHTRMVARKAMVAAVARMMNPGCKWDHTLVLYGPEGLGKSWWIDKVARGYSSSLGSITDKDTLLIMQRSWIMTSDEGHSLRKGDADQMKEFLTRTGDIFRMPYDRETLVHPRHCVIWSTTNDETFLRRQEGNRRFLIVHCEERVDFDLITDAYVDQLWAEAMYYFQAGERLYLEDLESEMAADERERFVEEDALAGVIQEYLDTWVPDDWWERSKESRRQWLVDREEGFEPEGTERINQTCSTQIWVEALGRRIGDHRRSDLLDITNAIKRLPDWEAVEGRERLPGYGSQLIFRRKGTE